MPRPKVTSIEIKYECPTAGEQVVSFDGEARHTPSFPMPFIVESESCAHCGHQESVSLQHQCACGKTHWVTLYSYEN